MKTKKICKIMKIENDFYDENYKPVLCVGIVDKYKIEQKNKRSIDEKITLKLIWS